MQTGLHQEVEPQTGVPLADHWHRAMTAESGAEREAAAWEVFLAATPGTELPGFCKDCVPPDALPLLLAAWERASGRCAISPLLKMHSGSDDSVRAMSARALVRLWLIKGDWDSNGARAHVRKLRFGSTREAFEEAIHDFSPSDLQSSLSRVKADQFRASAWAAPVGFVMLVAIGLAMIGIAVGFKVFGLAAGMGSLIFNIGRMLIRPGTHSSEASLKRWAPLLARIEERADENPEALKSVERELRLLTLRISDQPKEVRETAARLVRRIQENDRNVSQLPIAAASTREALETLPVPAGSSEC